MQLEADFNNSKTIKFLLLWDMRTGYEWISPNYTMCACARNWCSYGWKNSGKKRIFNLNNTLIQLGKKKK